MRDRVKKREREKDRDDRTRPQPHFKSFKQKPNLLIVWNVLLLLMTDSNTHEKKYADVQRAFNVTIHLVIFSRFLYLYSRLFILQRRSPPLFFSTYCRCNLPLLMEKINKYPRLTIAIYFLLLFTAHRQRCRYFNVTLVPC